MTEILRHVVIYDIHDHDELKEHLVPTIINGLIRRPDHVIGLHFHFAAPNEAGTILIECEFLHGTYLSNSHTQYSNQYVAWTTYSSKPWPCKLSSISLS